MRYIPRIIALALIILIGWFVWSNWQPAKKQSDEKIIYMEKITYTTTDNIEIIANYWKVDSDRGIILLHMMSTTKESWDDFGNKLSAAGFQVLAIDLRGHGESQGSNQTSINDVEGAREFLISKGITADNILVGGASIGANLAIQYLAQHHESLAGFALSPGLNYKDVEADEFSKELRDSQKIFLAAAEDDGYSAESVRKLKEITPAQATTKIYPSGGHGTDLLETQPELPQELVNFLSFR
ncbi:MAG: alpha/beta fold hydrolase [Patescibacteria group bacterium]